MKRKQNQHNLSATKPFPLRPKIRINLFGELFCSMRFRVPSDTLFDCMIEMQLLEIQKVLFCLFI